MPIFDEVSDQIKSAMRARDKLRLIALRGIRAAFIVGLKEDGSDTLADTRCVDLIRRLAKQRQDSIEAYRSAGREDLAAAESAELAVMDEFLPKLADEDTTRAWIQASIDATGANGQRELGKVMGSVMKAHRGEVDGNLARRIASELLGA